MRRILQQIGIPARLAPLGNRREDFSEIVAKALPSANFKNNPRPLRPEDLQHILARAL